MEDLLQNYFISYYNLSASTGNDYVLRTNSAYFEIEDTVAGDLVIHNTASTGMARFSNHDRLNLTIANYEKFVNGLSHAFRQSKKRCDLLLCCDSDRYFVLGELKDRNPN